MDKKEVIGFLPYSHPFLFVDRILKIDEEGVEGEHTFSPAHDFYKGHFKDKAITPGVILTECMAQIGLVCLGIFLLKRKPDEKIEIAMSSAKVDFYLPVLPGEKVRVESQKMFFRFGKLKCRLKMFNSKGKLVCRGEIAGMIKSGA